MLTTQDFANSDLRRQEAPRVHFAQWLNSVSTGHAHNQRLISGGICDTHLERQ